MDKALQQIVTRADEWYARRAELADREERGAYPAPCEWEDCDDWATQIVLDLLVYAESPRLCGRETT